MSKRIVIVFEETSPTPDGMSFNVFMEGIPAERHNLPEDQQTAAEFWARKMFAIVVEMLHRTGAMQTVQVKGDPK